MSELLFFILGMVIGGLLVATLLCCLQINRINDYERLLATKDKKDNSENSKCENDQ